MGVELIIKRLESNDGFPQREITLKEWEEYAANDLELYHSTSALRKQQGADAAQATVLVNVLKASGNSDLRKEIVEDLGKHYGTLPEVAEWMEHLAANEPDPKVRREAVRSLAK